MWTKTAYCLCSFDLGFLFTSPIAWFLVSPLMSTFSSWLQLYHDQTWFLTCRFHLSFNIDEHATTSFSIPWMSQQHCRPFWFQPSFSQCHWVHWVHNLAVFSRCQLQWPILSLRVLDCASVSTPSCFCRSSDSDPSWSRRSLSTPEGDWRKTSPAPCSFLHRGSHASGW